MGMDRNEAIEWLNAIKDKYIHGGDDYYDSQRKLAIDWAIHLLREEAVPVVRCKDCKKWKCHGMPFDITKGTCYNPRFHLHHGHVLE